MSSENPNSKRIWRIAISGVAIIIVVFASAILISRRSRHSNQTPLLLPPPVVTTASTPLPLQKCTLFFFDTDSRMLVSEERRLRLSQDITGRLKQTIDELLSYSADGLEKTTPHGTLLDKVYVDDRSIAYLDFSHHLKDKHIGGTTAEILTIKTILHTVQANFSGQIKAVQILIEGLEADTIAGHVDISQPLALPTENDESMEENGDGFKVD